MNVAGRMQRHHVRSIDELDLQLPGSVVTIGVFDGLHLGHEALIERLHDCARQHDVPSVCVTFSIHPRAVLGNASGPASILSLDHRLDLLEARDVDHAVVIEFSEDFAQLEPDVFVAELLVRRLGARELVIGHDTAIGRDRRGDAAFLAEAGRRYGFGVTSIGGVVIDGKLVSSTSVREAITSGDLAAAARMLGRPPSLLGTVVTGDGRGATIGVPTANLEVRSEAFPPMGVYAVTARTIDGDHQAVMNYGMRPTFKQDEHHGVFEIHILGRTDLQLYGTRLEVFLHEFLRPEKRFDGPDALVTQIRADCEAAAAIDGRAQLPPRR